MDKFWGVLVHYFHLIRHGPHRERRIVEFFVAKGTSLSSCYLFSNRCKFQGENTVTCTPGYVQGGPDSIRQFLIINNQSIQQHTGKWQSTFCCR
jgi:hypothetical protein